ncbi:carbonic anhydrase [Halobacterium wangiae]|uniref:carbonic anhydrase n=1 Tax=Halobacterium wangiae TaxID=2902623 RepID=UPI001E36BCD4|nr:carbonic anhydrase [Halobacterium wangiae]
MNRTVRELLERNAEHAATFHDRLDGHQDGQRPDVVSVCCSDSRVLGDHVWGNDEPGRIFTCSNIGNRVVQRTDDGLVVSGDVLYPLEHTGTDTAVVVGHTGCGAVTATYDYLTDGLSEPPGIEHCIELLAPHLEAGVERLPEELDREAAIDRLVEYNVDRQVDSLLDSEDVPDGVDVLGVVYDLHGTYSERRGEVHVVNVDGETDVDTLRDAHPDVDSRIARLWTY